MKFADKFKREWTIEITSADLKTLREDHGIDLRDALKQTAEANSVARAASDPETLGQILFRLCEDQIKERKLSPEEFAKSLTGPALRSALEALWGAIWDFFHGGKASENAAKAFRQAMNQTQDLLGTMWEKTADSLTSKSSAVNSVAAPALSPAPTV